MTIRERGDDSTKRWQTCSQRHRSLLPVLRELCCNGEGAGPALRRAIARLSQGKCRGGGRWRPDSVGTPLLIGLELASQQRRRRTVDWTLVRRRRGHDVHILCGVMRVT